MYGKCLHIIGSVTLLPFMTPTVCLLVSSSVCQNHAGGKFHVSIKELFYKSDKKAYKRLKLPPVNCKSENFSRKMENI